MFHRKDSQLTPAAFVKTLTFIHLGMIVGLVFFLMIALFSSKESTEFSFQTNETLLYVYPFIAIGGVVMSVVFSKALLKAAQQKTDLRSMLQLYQIATIVRYFCLEAAAFAGIVFYMMTSNAAFLAIVVLLILFLIFLRPTSTRIDNELALHGEMRNQFLRYDEVIR